MSSPRQNLKTPNVTILPKSARGGTTLIEMSVVIALSAVILGMVVTLLTTLLRHHHEVTARAEQQSEINRLTDVLRQDLRLASASEQPDATTLIVQLNDGHLVRYVLDGSICRRSREATASDAAQYDRFAIGPASGWQVEQSTADGPERPRAMSVTIELAPPDPHKSSPPPLRVAAGKRPRT